MEEILCAIKKTLKNTTNNLVLSCGFYLYLCFDFLEHINNITFWYYC